MVKPLDPLEVFLPDEADSGKVTQVKAKEIREAKGKYGSQKVKPFKPLSKMAPAGGAAANSKTEEKKTASVEIEMLDEDDKPVAGLPYQIKMPDGSVSSGTLDGKGYAKVDDCEPGEVEISFPDLDKDAWS